MAGPAIFLPASDNRNVAMTGAIARAGNPGPGNPPPTSTAMVARSRIPLSFGLSGVFSSACACFWDSQFHTKPVDFESLVRGLETFLETRNRRAQTGNVVPASMGRNPAALTKERSAMLTNTKPLLLVDDDLTNQDLLSRRLKRAGYATEVAGSGYEALDVLARREVELVLLDSMMPGLSGIELLRQLRQRFSPARLPIIMVTALGESERVVEALNLGANDYISKPVDFPVALARIKAQLERKRAEHALRASEERYALAARGANDGLWGWDLETQRVYFSPRWKAMLGYEEAEIGDGPEEWMSRVHKEDRAALGAELAAHWNATANKECPIEHRVLHKDGSYRWVLSRGVVERDGQGKATRMAGSQTDITSSKAFDPLTGLPNRTLFHDKLVACLERVAQEPDYPFAVLFLDLDRFKVINDSLGHMAGDELLIHVAQRLRSAVRNAPPASTVSRGATHDVIARLGGDEFAILLENVDADGAIRIADRIRESIHAAFKLESKEVFTAASIGIAPGNSGYRTPTEILRDADTSFQC